MVEFYVSEERLSGDKASVQTDSMLNSRESV